MDTCPEQLYSSGHFLLFLKFVNCETSVEPEDGGTLKKGRKTAYLRKGENSYEYVSKPKNNHGKEIYFQY